MEEHIEQIEAADWVDMDLLTKDLAGSLLDEEIQAEQQRIEALVNSTDSNADAIDKLRKRLAAMENVRRRVRGAK
ncbi:MAG: hypothetical protein C0482_23550 [Gordonia sp.]|nr:hypothetical protein [Gordonia sp. (in: high G+C Gram-positive bacteria)]